MITTIIARCFFSTGGWLDNGPQVDELRKQLLSKDTEGETSE